MIATDVGVPQGSVLGPVLYILCINELHNIVVDPECTVESDKNKETLFGPNYPLCGQIPFYTDNASFLISSKSRQYNQEKLRETLEKATVFLSNNDLIINQSKTILCEMMIKQKRNNIKGTPPTCTQCHQ